MSTSTLSRLQRLIHEQFDVPLETIDPDAPFADYQLDSLTLAELMFAIDDTMHVVVPDEALHTVKNLRDLSTLIDALPPTGHPAAAAA